MALVSCFSNPLALTTVSIPSSNASTAAHPKLSFTGIRLLQTPTLAVNKSIPVSAFVVKASRSEEAPSEGGEVALESKVKEQKARMKLAKKLRLRRKRLVRKRKLRKKGRWPPSKMNKLKNV